MGEYTYYLAFKKAKRSIVSFRIGGEDKVTTVIKLNGKNAEVIFRKILNLLSKYGAISPQKIGAESIYSVRDDVGPIIGSCLMMRRSPKPDNG